MRSFSALARLLMVAAALTATTSVFAQGVDSGLYGLWREVLMGGPPTIGKVIRANAGIVQKLQLNADETTKMRELETAIKKDAQETQEALPPRSAQMEKVAFRRLLMSLIKGSLGIVGPDRQAQYYALWAKALNVPVGRVSGTTPGGTGYAPPRDPAHPAPKTPLSPLDTSEEAKPATSDK